MATAITSPAGRSGSMGDRRIGRCCCNLRTLFYLSLCSFVFLQSLVTTGLTSSMISTLELRYGFTSTQSGIILAAYDVAALIIVMPASFYGSSLHKARTLGLGFAIFSIGCLLEASPQLFLPAYEPKHDDCSATAPESSRSAALALLVLGQATAGVGGAALYSLGPSCLDDIFPPNMVSVPLGLFYSIGALGPAFGFVIGGYTLGMYVDAVKPASIAGPSDPAWVGAWWIGWMGTGILGLVCSIPFFFQIHPLTKLRTETASVSNGDVEMTTSNPVPAPSAQSPPGPQPALSPSNSSGSLTNARISPSEDNIMLVNSEEDNQSLWAHTKILAKNVAILFNALGTGLEGAVVAALAGFLAKAVQLEYQIPAGDAAFMIGAVVVIGAAGGMFFGGWLMKFLKADAQRTATWTWGIAFGAFIVSTVLLHGCGGTPIAGVAAAAGVGGQPLAFASACNNNGHQLNGIACPAVYEPVCGADGLTYISACMAGCPVSNGTTISNCACVGATGVVTRGACMNSCFSGSLPLLLVGFAALMFITFMVWLVCGFHLLLHNAAFQNNTPASLVVIAGVPPALTGTAMALTVVAVKALGIPSPIAFGAILDDTCKFRPEKCGSLQNCAVYDMDRLRLSFFLWSICFKFLAFASFWYSGRKFKPDTRYNDIPPSLMRRNSEQLALQAAVEAR